MDKICKICGAELSLICFYESKRMKDGHRNECIPCTLKVNRRIYHLNKVKQKTKPCKLCGEPVKNDKRKFCSTSCSAKYRLSESENHPRYKGLDGDTSSIHRWVNKKKGGRPDSCEICGDIPKRGKDGRSTIHWANISGKYKRDLTDWMAMCITCHFNYDKQWKKRNRNEKGQFI